MCRKQEPRELLSVGGGGVEKVISESISWPIKESSSSTNQIRRKKKKI